MASSRGKRRGIGCFVLSIFGFLIIHQGSYLGSVYQGILVPVIQEHRVNLCGQCTYTSRETMKLPKKVELEGSLRAKLTAASTSGDKRTWTSRVVFLPPHDVREIPTGQSSVFYQDIPTYVRIEGSNDASIRPPRKITWVPLNSTTGEPIEGGSDRDCKPIAPWQTLSFPNCNTFHEMDFVESLVEFLNLGEYRDVWKVNLGFGDESLSKKEAFALKTLR